MVGFLVLLAQPLAAQDLDYGYAAFTRGDYIEAIKQWTPLSNQGIASAHYGLARVYYGGKGVIQNFSQALKYFRKAAVQNHIPTQWMIAETDQWFRDADSVTEWLEDGGLEKLFRYQEKISFNEAFRAFHEEIKDRGPRELVPPFSNFRTMVRAYVDNDPELEIVRLREGYKIRRRLLV